MRVLRSLPISLVVLLALATPALGIDGLLGGQGTAVTFTVYGAGLSWKGGAAEWSFACGGCLIRIFFSDASLVLVQNGAAQTLGPGAYELRDYKGYMSETMNAPGSYQIVLSGVGEINRLQ